MEAKYVGPGSVEQYVPDNDEEPIPLIGLSKTFGHSHDRMRLTSSKKSISRGMAVEVAQEVADELSLEADRAGKSLRRYLCEVADAYFAERVANPRRVLLAVDRDLVLGPPFRLQFQVDAVLHQSFKKLCRNAGVGVVACLRAMVYERAAKVAGRSFL